MLIPFFSSDVTILRNGIGERVAYLVHSAIAIATLLALACHINWKMTLLSISVLFPSMIGAGRLSFYFERREMEVEDQACDKAEAFAEKVLTNIKVVKLFNAEDYEFEKYSLILRDVKKLWKYICYSGICIFLLWAVYYFASALTLYFGRRNTYEYLVDYKSCPKPITELPSELHGAGAIFVVSALHFLSATCWGFNLFCFYRFFCRLYSLHFTGPRL